MGIMLFGLGGTAALALLYVWLRRRAAENVQAFRCGACSQLIRFTAAQAGAKGNCPRCWKPIIVPKTGSAEHSRQAPMRIRLGRLTAAARR